MTPFIRSLPSLLVGALFAAPALLAFSSGPTAAVSGVPTDNGGQTCTMCHTTFAPVNSDTRGRLEILLERTTYNPGIPMKVRVRLSHPTAIRWGFQLTARRDTDTSIGAGMFAGNDTVQVRCGLNLGIPPCTGETQPQFVEHVTTSTRPGTRDGVEWEFEWTPPINEVGDVTLFVSGNAANNSGTNDGDYIFNTRLTLKAEGACNQTRRPMVRTIGNAASYARELSPNVLASVFGLDFAVAGRTRAAGSGDFVNGAFPQELACVAIEVAGRRAPITYVQNDQINFQIPAGTPTGPVPLMVYLNPGRQNELRSDQATITIASHAPAFFTFNNQSIAAQTATFQTIADPAVVPGGVRARRGEVVILYGTGFGLTNPIYQAGEIPSAVASLRDQITVTVGGTVLPASEILYAGLSPGIISGLQQFNIRLPQSVGSGNVPISITVGGVASSTVGAVLPVAP